MRRRCWTRIDLEVEDTFLEPSNACSTCSGNRRCRRRFCPRIYCVKRYGSLTKIFPGGHDETVITSRGTCWALSGVLVVMVLLYAITASAQAPSIEGTYQLISRKLPDGTMLSPPEIMGLFTYTEEPQNREHCPEGRDGQILLELQRVHLHADGHGVQRDRASSASSTTRSVGRTSSTTSHRETRSTPVTVEGGRIQFKHPLSYDVFCLRREHVDIDREDNASVDVGKRCHVVVKSSDRRRASGVAAQTSQEGAVLGKGDDVITTIVFLCENRACWASRAAFSTFGTPPASHGR